MANILITILYTFLSLNGLLYKPLKNNDKQISWSNVNLYGRLMFFAIILLSVLSVYQTSHRIKVNNQLTKEQDDYNQYLVKIATRCEGYTIIIRGTIDFNNIPTELKIRTSLSKMFSQTGQLSIKARNQYGEYSCKIFLKEVIIRRFLNLRSRRLESDFMKRFESSNYRNPFFFEISAESIRPVNGEGLLFATQGNSSFQYQFENIEYKGDLSDLYDIRNICIKELIFDTSPPIPPDTVFSFK